MCTSRSRRTEGPCDGEFQTLVQTLVSMLFSDPAVTRIQTDPSPDNHRAIRSYEKAGFRAVKTITTPAGPAMYIVHDLP